MSSSARIVSILEDEFIEFAPALLPFLLQRATQELGIFHGELLQQNSKIFHETIYTLHELMYF